MATSRPAIPAETKREVLFEARHHCAVCCQGLPLEFAHVIPWRDTQDHAAENLIALCANCHERADKEDWGARYLQRYKKKPCILARDVPPPITADQKAVVDLIIAHDPDSMTEKERLRLVSMVAAYAGVSIAHVSILSVTSTNSARVRISMPREGAETLLRGFRNADPRLQAFLGEAGLVRVEPGPSGERGQRMARHTEDRKSVV